MTRTETRVGVLLVHGIGEQGRFQHLESEVRRISTAMAAEARVKSSRIVVRHSRDGAYGAQQATWRSDEVAPVTIEVIDQDDKVTNVEFREVWWADLDEPTTIGTQIRFWAWALSIWLTRGYMESKQPGYYKWMQPICEATDHIKAWDRLKLFVIAGVLFLPNVVLLLSNWILGSLLRWSIPFFSQFANVFVSYVGDVKLYQQRNRAGKGPLEDVGERPRVSVRRRMVRGLFEMALGGYDRWYILAHSLGSVASFNGLMDPDPRLPHYLEKETWQQSQALLAGKASETLSEDEIMGMRPRRPAWLEANDVILRKRLFEKLRGYLTYGSPIAKFVTLWPAIVPMNKELGVFDDAFEWINIIDTTDPVAGETTHFDLGGHGPTHLRYRADSFQIASHIKYLCHDGSETRSLANVVSRWLLTGQQFERPSAPSKRWPGERAIRRQAFSRDLCWVASGIFMAALLALAAHFVPGGGELSFGARFVIILGFPFVIALVAGLTRRARALLE